MRLIKPSFEIDEGMRDGDEILRRLRLKANTCYKPEKTSPKSDIAFMIDLVHTKKHTSVLRHEQASMKLICSRSVSHQIVRHGLAHFLQESQRYCVAGDTRLTPKNQHWQYTIKELYEAIQYSKNGSWKRLQFRKLDETTGELVYGKIRQVLKVGVKSVVRVKTYLGYELTCTPDHKLFTTEGYREAGAVLGMELAVNGANLRGAGTKGRAPWNKGLSAAKSDKVANAVRGLRKHHWNGGHAKTSTPKADRVCVRTEHTYGKLIKDECELCSSADTLDVHHINGDRSVNTDDNLITVCPSCHSRLHSKNLLFVHYDKVVSVEPAGMEEVYDLEMADGFSNFVADGVVVHNCNYSKKGGGDVVFIIPFWLHDQVPEGVFRHESEISTEPPANGGRVWLRQMLEAEQTYHTLIKCGWKPERARGVLPNDAKTEVEITANLEEWRHIFRQRADAHADESMQWLMRPALTEFKNRIPIIFDDL